MNNQDYTNKDEIQSQDINPTSSLDKMLERVNIADHLDKDELEKIGQAVYDGYKLDLGSKEHWDGQVDEWTRLAAQVVEEKSFPWVKASNVKYPLLATAA